ncbi:MAG: hypothetical protein ACR2IR_10670 [Acidimicrobiia bacterium]
MSTVPGDDDSSARSYNLEIFLISFAALLLEISYTRIVSFKLFYYYTYLVIGLALLGIGSGGVIVSISGRLRKASLDTILLWGLLLGGASVLVGHAIVAATTIDTLAIWEYGSFASFENVGRLLFICLALFSSFIAVGVMIATLFARRSHQIGRLYFADLLGAGLACGVVVFLLGSIGPPSTIVLAGLILVLAGLRIAWRLRAQRALPIGAVLAVVLVITAIWPTLLPRQRVEATKVDVDRQGTLFSAWSPIFRVDVAEVPDGRLLYHDGLVGSAIYPWDGDVADLARFETDPRVFPFAAVGEPPENVMIIGAAGGNEVLTSLYFDAGHVDAIELNPVTYDLVVDDFAEYTGNLAEHPKVNYVRGDGRSYLARSDDEYDLIFYPAPDSYSASNAATAGAFVLSEGYLYTTDTIVESFDHLSDDGIVAVQYGEYDYKDKPNRTTRYVATAREALSERGVDDPARHIVVITSPTGVGGTYSTILVKEKPFTTAEVERTLEKIPVVPGAKLRYAPGNPVEGQSVSEVATLPNDELDAFYESYPYDVRPITDDGPFFWHFTEFRDVISDFGDPIDRDDPEDSV